MADSSQSKSIPPQTNASHSNDYRQQQENLKLTKSDWLRILREGGINVVLQKKKQIDDEWKKQPVLIALIGQTGSGKSTLIRRSLGLLPNDPGEPAINRSVKECTKESKEYPKSGTGLVYVDLPGVESTTARCAFKTPEEQEAYCEHFRLQTIEYFLLLSQNKFTVQEKLLAEYITQRLHKKFIFIQTKMDNLRTEYGNEELEEKEGYDGVKNMVRTDIQKQLGLKNATRIFLISNKVIKVGPDGQQCRIYDNSSDYEFDLLVKQIQDNMLGEGGLSAKKGEAFVLATDAISKSAIRAKANVLRNRAWGWSILSGTIGVVPIPNVSLKCDASIIIAKATDYFNAFGLNLIHHLGEGTAMEKIEKLTKMMRASLGARYVVVTEVAIKLSVLKESSKFIPMVGSILGSGISFASTCAILRLLIDFCEMEALKVLRQG